MSMYLKGEDMAAVDDVLHCLLVVLHLGGLEDDRKLGCAASRNDLHPQACTFTGTARHVHSFNAAAAAARVLGCNSRPTLSM